MMDKPEWIVPKDIDKECVNICKAINEIYGLHTIESCCGHGQDRFAIFFEVYDYEGLPYLLRQTQKLEWICDVSVSNIFEDRLTFWLRSQNKGETAYKEADLIALYLGAE